MSGIEPFDHLGDRVSAFLDGELGDEEMRAVEAHLDVCDHCRMVLRLEDGTRALVRGLDPVDPPEGFLDQVLRLGPVDRRAGQRRTRFAVANLVASAAVWLLVLGLGHLTARGTVEPAVGSYVRAHEASVAGGGVPGTSGASLPAAHGLPVAAEQFELVRYSTDGIRDQALYTNGADVVSVFRQVGALDWAAIAAEGADVQVGGDHGVLIRRGVTEVLFFERGDYAYAIVAPAHTGVIEGLIDALPGQQKPSLIDRAKQAVDGLLDCFGLRG
jgi:hypothetical protein